VMILGVVFLKESLNWKQWLGGALILAGVILVAMPTAKEDANSAASTDSKIVR
jgi:drug/metabolite transporter (DMT)-like permease